MLVPGADILELHPRGTVELHGLFDVLALFSDQLHAQASLFEDLAHGRVVGYLVPLYMILNLHTLAGYAPH